MKLSNNTVLVTGGASGIGWAIAERFLQAGSTVIICGRRQDKLAEAKQRYPQLNTVVSDVADPAARAALVERVTREFPALNVLVNNAGIQQRATLLAGMPDWSAIHQEIAINLEAPIDLTMRLIPHLRQQEAPAILNVSSGLAFAPMPAAPVYCATKAAIHSFTQSLRVQATTLGIDVVEIIPPAVQTDLGGAGLHTFGVPLEEFADAVMARVANGETEIGYGTAEASRQASREELNAMLARLANISPEVWA